MRLNHPDNRNCSKKLQFERVAYQHPKLQPAKCRYAKTDVSKTTMKFSMLDVYEENGDHLPRFPPHLFELLVCSQYST